MTRREQHGDEPAISRVHTGAFRRPEAPSDEPPEVELVDCLRASDAWLPRLSIVAIAEGRVVGHVLCSRATLRPGGHTVLGLAPLGVDPEHQGRGAGTALMHAVLGAAEALDESLVGLVGDPGYYQRFGFEPAGPFRIDPLDPAYGEHFQVRPLANYRPDLFGTFAYASPFTALE